MILQAIRATYLNSDQKDFVRLTTELCVAQVDMPKLKKVVKHDVNVSGEIKKKWFQPLNLNGKDFLAEVVTGTLYDADTGYSPAPTLFIPEITNAYLKDNGRVPRAHGKRPVGGQRSKSKFRQGV
jgi:hypothetical protein